MDKVCGLQRQQKAARLAERKMLGLFKNDLLTYWHDI